MEKFHAHINRFSRNITAFFDEKLKGYGLAVSYIEMMLIINHHAECSQKMLSDEMGLAPSTITRFIEKLVKKGFVEKYRSGKEMYVKLTPNGYDTAAHLKKAYRNAETELQALLGEKYFETTGKLIEFGIEVTEEAEK